MTLDEKRRAAEVLLCAGDYGQIMSVVWNLLASNRTFKHAAKLRREASDEHAYPWTRAYQAQCIEAAYRLISSSPTLRREFFARGAR